MENLELNYNELAFIMDLKAVETKELFASLLGVDKPKATDLIRVELLTPLFDNIKSVDKRYDGKNKLLFYLEMKKNGYKKALSVKSCIKHKKFTGKYSIYYKILDENQLLHAKECLAIHNKFHYPKGVI